LGKVPWQVAPASAETARVHGDVPEMTQVEGWGPVLATRRVLATFPADLPARPGRNRVIDPCWDAVAGAAARVGPAFVEMASRGPERRVGSDRYEGMVEVRIIWTREGHREVRQATMRCVTTDEGQLLDAGAIYPIDREDGSDARRPA
jgi:hypothetical protein